MARSTSKESKEEAATALYLEIRKTADKELKGKNYLQSCREYISGAKLLSKSFADSGNRLSALYAGAANAARCQNKYALSLSYFEQSITHLKADQENFTEMVQYIVDVLLYVIVSLKSEQQKQSIKLLANKLLRKYGGKIKDQAPQAKTKSYVLAGSRINDRFSALEDNNEITKKWLEKQALVANLTMLPIIATFKKPKEFYKAAYAQSHNVPFRVADFYFYVSTDKSGYKTIRRAAANAKNSKTISARAKIVFASKRVGDNDSWMSGFRVNRAGTLLAYGLSKGGSDFETWHIRDLTTGKDLPDRIEDVQSGSIQFHRHKAGLIYRSSHQDKNTKKEEQQEPSYTKRAAIYFHRFGDLQKKDKVLHLPTPDWVDIYGLGQSSKHLLISEWPTAKLHNRLLIKSLSSGQSCPLFPRKIGYYRALGESKGKLFIRTDHKAPRGRILALTFDFNKLIVKSVEEIVPESQFTLQDVRLLQDRIVASCLDNDGKARLLQFSLEGNMLKEITLPFEGTLSSLSTSFKDSNIFFSLENFAVAKTIYRHDLASEETVLMYKPRYSMAKRVIQKMVHVKSKDGTMVPMNIAYLKGTKFNSNNGTLLSVYGGFSIACLPYFSYQTATWLAMGGVWAQPYLRGGDELGANWHASATKENKQLTYDDTIASAEWLVKAGLSKPNKIAICGGSNGGLTVGAAITQRPDLFGAAIADNGLFDMLKFSFHGLGWAWQSEYGSVKNARELKALRAYSPYHQVQRLKDNTDFPHLLINASAGDNRVVPWHSYKFAAACQQQGFPVLLNVKWQEGHGWGRPDWSVRDNLAYLQWALKMK